MNDRTRSIKLPQWLWDELDREAMDSRRSSIKQLETILAVYYRGEAPNVNADKLHVMSGAVPASGIELAPAAEKAMPSNIRETTTEAKRKTRK